MKYIIIINITCFTAVVITTIANGIILVYGDVGGSGVTSFKIVNANLKGNISIIIIKNTYSYNYIN